MYIINIKTFPEYTAVFISGKDNKKNNPEVKRCNYVCADCWKIIAKYLNKDITSTVSTYNKWVCDMCWGNKHITAIRHFISWAKLDD